jgi:hypothetical protein
MSELGSPRRRRRACLQALDAAFAPLMIAVAAPVDLGARAERAHLPARVLLDRGPSARA